METGYGNQQLTRAEVDAWPGAAVLEFGVDWCGHCQGAQPRIAEALPPASEIRHVKVEDGPGRPLGRSFKVKLWPTLVFLKEGAEVARVVRPQSSAELREALEMIQM